MRTSRPVTNWSVRHPPVARDVVDVQLHVGGDDRLVLVVLVLVRHGLGGNARPRRAGRGSCVSASLRQQHVHVEVFLAGRAWLSILWYFGSAKARRIWPMFRCGILSSTCQSPFDVADAEQLLARLHACGRAGSRGGRRSARSTARRRRAAPASESNWPASGDEAARPACGRSCTPRPAPSVPFCAASRRSRRSVRVPVPAAFGQLRPVPSR